MRKTVVILEDDERRRGAMKVALGRRLPSLEPVFFDNSPDMVAWLRDHLVDLVAISLDHDLGPDRERDGRRFDPGTGRDVADILATHQPCCPGIIATTNALARPGMEMTLQDAGWVCQSITPFNDLQWIEDAWADALVSICESDESQTTHNKQRTSDN